MRASQAKTQLEARLQSQQGTLQEWQARAAQSESRADTLVADLQASAVKLERAEQTLREANVLSAERATSYEAQIGELNGRLDAMKIGQRSSSNSASCLRNSRAVMQRQREVSHNEYAGRRAQCAAGKQQEHHVVDLSKPGAWRQAMHAPAAKVSNSAGKGTLRTAESNTLNNAPRNVMTYVPPPPKFHRIECDALAREAYALCAVSRDGSDLLIADGFLIWTLDTGQCFSRGVRITFPSATAPDTGKVFEFSEDEAFAEALSQAECELRAAMHKLHPSRWVQLKTSGITEDDLKYVWHRGVHHDALIRIGTFTCSKSLSNFVDVLRRLPRVTRSPIDI